MAAWHPISMSARKETLCQSRLTWKSFPTSDSWGITEMRTVCCVSLLIANTVLICFAKLDKYSHYDAKLILSRTEIHRIEWYFTFNFHWNLHPRLNHCGFRQVVIRVWQMHILMSSVPFLDNLHISIFSVCSKNDIFNRPNELALQYLTDNRLLTSTFGAVS